MIFVSAVTPLDIPRAGAPSLTSIVQNRGELSGVIAQSLPGGRVIVETAAGRFSLTLSEPAAAGRSVRFTMADGVLQAELGPPPAALVRDGATPPLTRASLDEILLKLDIPRTDTARVIVRALVQAGIPVSASLVETLSSALGDLDNDQADALAFLISRGAPLSAGTIAQVAAAKPNALAELVAALAQIRNRLAELLPAGAAGGRAQSAVTRLIGAPVSIGADAGVIRDHLEKLLSGSGLDHERALAQMLAGGTRPADVLAIAAESLKGDLLLLRQSLAELLGGALGTEDAQRLQQLSRLLDRALASVETAQLSALPHAARDDAQPFVLFLPLVMDEEPSTLLFMVEDDGSGGAGGGNGKRLTLQLDMTRLGTVRIQLAMQDGGLAVRFALRDEETREYIAHQAPALTERLEAAGYRTNAVFAQLERTLPAVQDLITLALAKSRGSEVRGFDTRA